MYLRRHVSDIIKDLLSNQYGTKFFNRIKKSILFFLEREIMELIIKHFLTLITYSMHHNKIPSICYNVFAKVYLGAKSLPRAAKVTV